MMRLVHDYQSNFRQEILIDSQQQICALRREYEDISIVGEKGHTLIEGKMIACLEHFDL